MSGHGGKMRRLLSILGCVAVAGVLVTTMTSASATTSQTAAAAITLQGSIAGGIKVIGFDQPLTFVFTETNHGTKAISEYLFINKMANTSVAGAVCVLPGGLATNPDGPSCEPSTLKPGQSGSYVLTTQVTGSGTASVQVCTYNANGGAPGPCKTLSATG